MSADPPYDDAISRLTGSQGNAGTSEENQNEPVYSVAKDTHTNQSVYTEDDINEALLICQTVEDAVAEDSENIDTVRTLNNADQDVCGAMSDPVYKAPSGAWGGQEPVNKSEEIWTGQAQFTGVNHDLLDPVYKGGNEPWLVQPGQSNNDMSEPVYRASEPIALDHGDMQEPVYQDAAETVNKDLLEVQIRPTSALRRRSQDPENVYSFAKESDRASEIFNKRHGIHGEKSLSVHGDVNDLVIQTNKNPDQGSEQEENKYMSLKDVIVDNTLSAPILPPPRTASENKDNVDSSKTATAFHDSGEYEIVDYAKVKKPRTTQRRKEAVVRKKVSGGKLSPIKKSAPLMISEKDRKAAKQKSRALKRSGRPFPHHSSLQDPKAGAIAELEDSNNLEHFANPFTVSSSDSFESFSDSTFDSCDSWSSDNSFHSGDEGPPNKPLPQPPERKKKDKDILDQHLAELRADLEHFLEHGDESVFEKNPYFRSDFQEFQGGNLKNLIPHPHSHGKTGDESPILPFVSNRPRPPPALPEPPEKMSQGQIKLAQVLESLANSEKSYIESLERLHKEYTPIFERFGILSKTNVAKLFKTVEDILNIHKIGQIELSDKFSQWYQDEKIGALFGFFSKEMVIVPYSDYVNHYEAVSEVIKEAMNSKAAFLEELKTKQCSSVDRLSLAGLMLKPVQRFPQFIMIIKDILKHTPRNHHDRENLQEGLTGIENVAHQLNEGKRRSEQKFHGQEIISRLSPRLPADKKAFLIRQDDVKQLSEELVGAHQSQTKTRRLFLLNDKLVSVSVTQREQDGHTVDKFTYKWSQKLEDLEIQMTAIMPHMVPKVSGGNPTSIVTPKPDGKEEDPFQLASDLSDMLHDVNVLGRISHLATTLKCSYQGFSEDIIQKLIADLQAQIQNKDYQLQLLNSSSIILRDTSKSKKYVFETASPAVKQEWFIDFMLAKYALDIVNIPSWYEHDSSSTIVEMPAFLMKHMSVDMQRTYSKIKCAIPVYLPVSSEGAVEHLWVCSSTESAGQISLISLHTPKPNLVMSFKATDCDIEAVVMVPGYAMAKGLTIFEDDTVWISTAKSEICVFLLHENLVKHQDSTKKLTSKEELTQFIHKFKPGCVIISMVYQDDCVFCGTRNGTVIVYGRDDDGAWGSSGTLSLCNAFSVTSIITVGDGVWAACGKHIFIIAANSLDEYKIQDRIDTQKDNQVPNTEVHFLTKAGVGVWASFSGQSKLYLYHTESKKFLQEVDICTAVNSFISVFTSTKEARKDYQVSSLVASLGLLWIGTNDGIVLTYPLPRLRDGVPKINRRPQVSLHGHNGPVKFLMPVHYGPLSGSPIRRKVSSILKKSESDKNGLTPSAEGKNENEVFEDCSETPVQKNNTYESVRLSKGSQHEYETHMTVNQVSDNVTTNKTSDDSEANEVFSAINKLNENVEAASHTEGETKVTVVYEREAANQDLQSSAEHTYFVLEPDKDSKDKKNGNQNLVQDNTGDENKHLQNDDSVTNGATAKGDKPAVKQQISFHSELAKKVQERKVVRELEEQAVDEAEIDDLYGFLKSETKVNTSRTLTVHDSTNYSDNEHVASLQGSLYRRDRFERAFEARPPSQASVKRRSSFRTTNTMVANEAEKQENKNRHRIGSSFTGGSSVDTLRKQDTKTMLVVSGGNGYKDWKKRQSYQYRTDEACLVIWMYKV